MITVRVLNAEPLEDIREAIAATLGKEEMPTSPSDLLHYYVNLFIQNHSVVRAVRFRIKDTEADKSVTRQLLRATTGSPQPYVESGRPDWTGKPRDDSATCLFLHDHTAESFINEARQRLCYRAWKPTRDTVLDIIREMWYTQDSYFQALAICCVPNCYFQYGCPEGKFDCGWFSRQDVLPPIDLYLRRYHYFKHYILDRG